MSIRPAEKFVSVNPKGGFFNTGSSLPQKPTKIDFVSQGFSFRNYIGLSGHGFLKYGNVFQDNIYSLAMKSYRGIEFVPQDVQVIFRPGDPMQRFVAEFGPEDSHYPDNSDPNGDYGVVISYPNSKPPHYSILAEGKHLKHDEFDDEISLFKSTISDNEIPENLDDDEAPLLYETKTKPFPSIQYRGWYENNIWIPEYSTYLGRQGKFLPICPKSA